MDINDSYQNFPGMTSQEMKMLQQATATLTEVQQRHFLGIYSGKRKSPEDVMLYCIISIFIPGLHRFMLGQTTWGILYFFTGGFFFVMTVVDMISYKGLAFDHNQDAAYEAFRLTRYRAAALI